MRSATSPIPTAGPYRSRAVWYRLLCPDLRRWRTSDHHCSARADEPGPCARPQAADQRGAGRPSPQPQELSADAGFCTNSSLTHLPAVASRPLWPRAEHGTATTIRAVSADDGAARVSRPWRSACSSWQMPRGEPMPPSRPGNDYRHTCRLARYPDRLLISTAAQRF
jgi:hypothetical protein